MDYYVDKKWLRAWLLISFAFKLSTAVSWSSNDEEWRYKAGRIKTSSTDINNKDGVEFINDQHNLLQSHSDVYSYALELYKSRRLNSNNEFDELNSLFLGTKIKMPSSTFDQDLPWPFQEVNIIASNIICERISIKNIDVDYTKISNQKLVLNVVLEDISIDCSLKWEYQHNGGFNLIKGEGMAYVYTTSNSLNTSISFLSKDFLTTPPHASVAEHCKLDINVENIKMEGGVMAKMANLFESFLKDTIEDQTSTLACTQLGTMAADKLSAFLLILSDNLSPYLNDTTKNKALDPLAAQKALMEEAGFSMLNFQNVNYTIGNWFTRLVHSTFDMLGSPVARSILSTNQTTTSNTSSSTATATTTLQINEVLQSTFLTPEGSLNVPLEAFYTDNNTNGIVLFQGNDMLTETIISLTKMQIAGLNSITAFDPLNVLSNHTLSNTIDWENIRLEADLMIVMKPSSNDNSIIVDTNTPEVVEHISIKGGFAGIAADVSFLLAIIQTYLGTLEIGSLLHHHQIFPCFLSTIHAFNVTQLSVSVQDIIPLVLDNFISKGLDTIISTATEAAFLMYEPIVKTAIPNYFQDSLRVKLNERILNYTMEDENTVCPNPLLLKKSNEEEEVVENNFQEYVDFRLLFQRSTTTNITTGQPLQDQMTQGRYYGTLPSLAMNTIDKYLLTPNEQTSYPKINDLLVRPFTISNSNTAGTYNLLNSELNIQPQNAASIGFHNLSLQIYETKLIHLDTIDYPFYLLQPDTTDPTIVKNAITFGTQPEKPLGFQSNVLLHLNNSIIQAIDQFVFSLNVSNLQVTTDILAKVDEERFMTFPLKNVIHLDCWLATIAPPELLNQFGLSSSSSSPTAALQKIGISIDDVSLGIDCVSCTSTGMKEIPAIIKKLENNQVLGNVYLRAFTFIKEFAEGDYVQSIVNQALYDASSLCLDTTNPGKVTVGTKQPKDVASNRVSIMTRNGMEFMILSSVIAMQTLSVVITKSLLHDPPLKKMADDTTSVNNEFNVFGDEDISTQQLTLLDFTQLGDNIGPWFPTLLEEATTIINAPTIIDPETNKTDLGINIFVRNSIYPNGVLTISNLDLVLHETYGFTFTLHEVNITGLDTFTIANVFNITGSHAISNHIAMEQVGVQLTFILDFLDSNQEELIIDLELTDFDVVFDLLVAMNLQKLGDVQVGSLLDIKHIIPCIVSTAHIVQITNFPVNVGKISGRLSGSIIENIRDDLDKVTDTILGTYKESIIESLPFVFHSIVRPTLNTLFETYQEQHSSVCKLLESGDSGGNTNTNTTTDEFIDFRDLFLSANEARKTGTSGSSPYGNLFRFIKKLLDEEILGPDNTDTSKLNKLIRSITQAQSNQPGTIHLPGFVYKSSSKLNIPSVKGTADIGISNVRIHNLDTFGYPLHMLTPNKTNPHVLESGVTMGAAGDNPIQVLIHILVALKTDTIDMENEFDISLDIDTISILLDLLAKIDANALFRIPLRHMLNYNCWLATIPAPILNDQGIRNEQEGESQQQHLTASLQKIETLVKTAIFGVNCTFCSSPALSQIVALSSTEEAIEDSTNAVNNLLHYISNIVKGEYSQVKIDRFLNDARNLCPLYTKPFEDGNNIIGLKSYSSFNSVSYTDENIKAVLGIAIAILVIIFFISIVFFARNWIIQRRHKHWLHTLSETQALYHYENQLQSEQESKALNCVTKSMLHSDAIPMWVRMVMPVVLILNIGLFLSGHLDLGATITIRMQIAGQDMPVDKFFEFSMGKSVVDMWKAGAKFLAALICFFSGVWPYSKQLISFYLWFAPPTWVSVRRRGSIFHWLDALAKWSMVDIFVLIMSMIGFWVSIQSPQKSFLPDNLYSINLMVIPVWGLYANLIAQLISQISSHFIVHYHHKVEREGLSTWKKEVTQASSFGEDNKLMNSFGGPPSIENASSDEEESELAVASLQNHTFSLEREHQGKNVQVRKVVSPGFAFLCSIVFSFFVVGFILPSFQVEYLGIVGILVEMGQQFQQAVYTHSMFSITEAIMNQAKFLDSAKHNMGLGLLAIVFVVTSFVMPLIQLVIICVLWFKPMLTKSREQVLLALDTIQSWQYAEVYVISVFIGTWQFGGVSSFMINDFCGSLSSTFSSLAYYGIVSEEDAQCFYVESTISAATYFLIVASILLYLMTRFVKKASLQQLMDKRLTSVDTANMTDAQMRLYLADKHMSVFKEENQDVAKTIIEQINPVKIQFTDEYSCLLKVMNTMGDNACSTTLAKQIPRFLADEASVSLSISDVEMNPSTPVRWDKSSAFEKPCANDDDNNKDEDASFQDRYGDDKRHKTMISKFSSSFSLMKRRDSSSAPRFSPSKDISQDSLNLSISNVDIVHSTMPFFGKDLDNEVNSILSVDLPSPLTRKCPISEDEYSLPSSHVSYDTHENNITSPMSTPTGQKQILGTTVEEDSFDSSYNGQLSV